MTDGILELVKFLFGGLGPLNFVLLGVTSYLAYLFDLEKKGHQATWQTLLESQEKRFEAFAANLKVLVELQDTLENLTSKIGDHK